MMCLLNGMVISRDRPTEINFNPPQRLTSYQCLGQSFAGHFYTHRQPSCHEGVQGLGAEPDN